MSGRVCAALAAACSGKQILGEATTLAVSVRMSLWWTCLALVAVLSVWSLVLVETSSVMGRVLEGVAIAANLEGSDL